MTIGNWIIDTTNEQIVWTKNERFFITKEMLFSSSPSRLYVDSILNVCDKDDVTESDIYALNSAIMCAVEIFNMQIPEGFRFVTMVEAQLEIIRRDKTEPSIDENEM